MTTNWSTKDIPSQVGRRAIVTGTGGIGFEVARALVIAGAEVIVAGRNPANGEAAVARLRQAAAAPKVSFEVIDLASLVSIAAFGARMKETHDRIDLLVNNAGVMTPSKRRLTEDGFELQFGTNHLGHFALTAHLLPLLHQGSGARVISLGSVAARGGVIDFDDLHAERGYRPMPVYSQSKLACLLFAFELQRRSAAHGWGLSSIAAHPGIARTDLLLNSPGRWDMGRIARTYLAFLFQPVAQAALPVLYAATAPDAVPGVYYGPDRMGETRGHPAVARVPPKAQDTKTAGRLWDVSEQLTGVSFTDATLR